ncbi:MAG TPA: O-antigen translocase [Ferruginibacter sp.]|nr:O-antigen translocase [Ferruginibacter sp.]
MNIFKVSFYSAISQVTSILVGLVAVKILAVQIGPEGVALQSQFLNSIVFFYILSTGAINSGTIKYLSEFFQDKGKQLLVIRTSLTICVICSVITGLVLLALSKMLATRALMNPSFSSAYLLYGLFLPIISLNFIFSSILNGLREIKYLTIINVITSIVNLVFLILFSNSFQLYGILIYANFSNLLIFILHILLIRKYKWFSFRELKPLLDKEWVLKLFSFSLMAIFATCIGPLAQIIIRNILIADYGLGKAGEWQTVTRISDFYLSFLTGVLSIYLLPKLSSLVETKDIRAELLKTAKLVFPVVIILTLGIWLGRDLIIKILLTDKFAGTRELFNFQLLGDIFKIGGWGLSMVLWAKAKTKMYLITDSISLLVYLVITIVCIHYFATMGATIGFCISYFIYFITMIILNKKYLF